MLGFDRSFRVAEIDEKSSDFERVPEMLIVSNSSDNVAIFMEDICRQRRHIERCLKILNLP